jgi:hypothetical protein
VPRCPARSVWAPEDQKHHGDQEHRGDLQFRQAPVVGVPIVEVANTLTSLLRWMASSHAGRLDTKTTSLRSARLST